MYHIRIQVYIVSKLRVQLLLLVPARVEFSLSQRYGSN